jgi:hypothetical protein
MSPENLHLSFGDESDFAIRPRGYEYSPSAKDYSAYPIPLGFDREYTFPPTPTRPHPYTHFNNMPSWDESVSNSNPLTSTEQVYAPKFPLDLSNFQFPNPPPSYSNPYPTLPPQPPTPIPSPTLRLDTPSPTVVATPTPSPTSVSPPPIVANPAKRHKDFTVNEYLGLARIIVEKKPYSAKHGEKAQAWAEVAKMCKEQGFFLTSSPEVIKNKASALIKYQEVSFTFVIG